MNLDELNNSQIALLTMVISVVVSIAISVAVLSLFISDLSSSDEKDTPEKTTVVRHIINRLDSNENKATEDEPKAEENEFTFEKLISSVADIYENEKYLLSGVFVNKEGHVITNTSFKSNIDYGVKINEEIIDYSVKKIYNNYTLLAPVDTNISVKDYLRPIPFDSINLGSYAIVYSKYKNQESFFSEVVSKLDNDENRFQISVDLEQVDLHHIVVIDGYFAGYLSPNYRGWVSSISNDFIINNNI